MDDLQKKRIDRAIKEIYERFKNPVPMGAPAYDEYWQDLIDVTDALAYLVKKMMMWFDVTPEALESKGVIHTPIDPLRWDYYRYILAHPTEEWPVPTAILYGGRDELQSMEVMKTFCERFRSGLTVSPDSEHPFMAEQDVPIVESWLRENI